MFVNGILMSGSSVSRGCCALGKFAGQQDNVMRFRDVIERLGIKHR